MTAFKRRARLQQAQWREKHGYPIGVQKVPNKDPVNVGSRMPVAYARDTMANFLSDGVKQAVKERLAVNEPHQTLNTDRLYSDLLSSMPMCFNLFGELAADRTKAQPAVEALWPELQAENASVRLEHSPGRRDEKFLGDRTAFDAAITYEGAAGRGIIGIETKYHEHAVREKVPAEMRRYEEVTTRSKVFERGWQKAIVGTELQQIWRDHLLVLSMLQCGEWTEGRYVLVFPAANLSFAAVAEQYRSVLVDDATFEVRTLETVVDSLDGVLAAGTLTAFRERYLFDDCA